MAARKLSPRCIAFEPRILDYFVGIWSKATMYLGKKFLTTICSVIAIWSRFHRKNEITFLLEGAMGKPVNEWSKPNIVGGLGDSPGTIWNHTLRIVSWTTLNFVSQHRLTLQVSLCWDAHIPLKVKVPNLPKSYCRVITSSLYCETSLLACRYPQRAS